MSKSEEREVFEIYAVKYAHNGNRTRNSNMLYDDEHDRPMPLDYFVWVIKNDKRTYVVDTGFGEVASKKRAAPLLRSPAEGLAMMGIDAAEVENVIISHMHYDHCGDLSSFPNAKFYLQDREMSYCTGRCMMHAPLRHPYAVDYVIDMVRLVYDDRVQYVDGEMQIAPGISVHHIGGHTDGVQSVRVWTKKGWLVLASDANHFYDNIAHYRRRYSNICCFICRF